MMGSQEAALLLGDDPAQLPVNSALILDLSSGSPVEPEVLTPG
jgi:hypothetical protein